LNENNIPIILRDDSIDISTSIEEKDLNKFTDLLFLKMEIILENIYNVNTTRTSNGGPYKRIIIEITNGEIEIHEDNLNPKLVYDPIHPDAIKSGPRACYVEFPAIDIVLEIVDYISTARILEITIAKLQENEIINQTDYKKLMTKQENVKKLLDEIIENKY
jgi:flagellar basal-body rod protein FlgC